MRQDLDHALAQTSKVEEHEGDRPQRSLDPNASAAAAHSRLGLALHGCGIAKWPVEVTQGAPTSVELRLDVGLVAAIEASGRVVREESGSASEAPDSPAQPWGSTSLEEEEDRFEVREDSLIEQQERTVMSMRDTLNRSMKLTS